MDDEVDNPPSYSDAMAAIAEGMRRQGIQTRDSFTSAEMSGHFSDVIVIFPPSRDSLSSTGSSFQVVNPSLPSEPPPPYTEHTPPSSPVPRQSDLPQCHSSTSSTANFNSSSSITSTAASLSNIPSDASKKQPHRQSEFTSLPSTTSCNHSNLGLAIGGVPQQEPDEDPSLPGRVIFEQAEYVISSSSPSCTDIKWRAPDNASNFRDLVYVVEMHASCNPALSVRPKFKSNTSLEDSDWMEFLDTSRPSIRVYLTQSSLIIGPAKWKLKDPLTLRNVRVRMRVRAAADCNRLPSCKKGPWSQDLTVQYIDTAHITQSQEKEYAKSRKSGTQSSSKEQSKRKEPIPVSVPKDLNNLGLGHITLKATEYHLSTDTSIQTYISWKIPSNSGCFAKVWYEVQCLNKAPLALCSKGVGKTVERLCERDTAASVGQLGGWMTITEVQSASLRVQKLSQFLSIGQYKWDISSTEGVVSIDLRIRPVGILRNGVVTGPWSETVRVHFNREQRKN